MSQFAACESLSIAGGKCSALSKTNDGYYAILSYYRKFAFTTLRQTVWPESFSALFGAKFAKIGPAFADFRPNRTAENRVQRHFAIIKREILRQALE